MRKILALLLSVVLLAGICGAAWAEGEQPADEWTVMIYLCGTDLESGQFQCATHNLQQIAETIPSDSVNVVIETGGTKEWHAEETVGIKIANDKLQRWTWGPEGFTLVEELPEACMSHAETLSEFIRWSTEKYPAKKHMLLLWDHGGGSNSGLICDENYGMTIMPVYSLERALKEGGTHFDLFLTDTCLMEFPFLNEVYQKYSDRVAFIALSVEPKDTMEDIAEYRRENNVALPMGRDEGEELYQYIRTNGIPDTVVIDRFGNAVFFHDSAFRSAGDAKVRTMMNQIRPHFIYNTLTSIYVLCRDDPERAALMVQNFTEYLQSNFTAMTATELITFPDELRHTKAYVSVESFRYRDKLTVEYDIRHSAFRLPALTLQPLVENAIKHCLGKGIAPEHIVISSWAEGAVSCITVKDNGPGFDPQEQIGEEHVGLENVRERLQLMCGGTLDIQSSKDSGTLITISIPTSRTGDMLP